MGLFRFLKDLFGPRKPCALCRLGQSSWSSDRSGVADWKIRGHGLDAELLICGGCRQFLIENGLERKTPMWGLAHLVAVGRAQRPSLSAYLQHPEWRKIWLHILDTADQRPSDEFEALSMMEPLEEEFMSRAGVGATTTSEKSTGPDPTDPDSRDPMNDPRLRRIMEEHGIPEDVIQRKYRSYSLVLQGQDGNWNADIDDHAREIGALTEDEIRAARTDFHQAVLNRVKVALVAEGYAPSLETRSNESGAGEKSGQELPKGVPDPFPEEIDVPGDDPGLKIPAVSCKEARDSEEYERKFKTALGGAASLLIPRIQRRASGQLDLPTVRECALRMVYNAYEEGRVPEEDTRGFFIGGLERFNEYWDRWEAPVEMIRDDFGEGD